MHDHHAYVARQESRPQNITIAKLHKYRRAVGARLKVEVYILHSVRPASYSNSPTRKTN